MFQVLTQAQALFVLIVSTGTIRWVERAQALNVLIGSSSYGHNTMNLTAGQYLNVSRIYLVMQPDCNLVTYNGSTPMLTTTLRASRNCYATLQANGNFVINQRGGDAATSETTLWSSQTPAWGLNSSTRFSTYRYMILRRDGSLNMFGPDNRLLPDIPLFAPVNESRSGSDFGDAFPPGLEWRPSVDLDGYPYMPAEYFLAEGSRLQTVDKRFVLRLDHNCKLQSQEIWNENSTVRRVVWEAPGPSSGSCELRLHQDGLLAVRDTVSGTVRWDSSARGDDSVNWVLKLNADDGHVSVSDILNLSNILRTNRGGATPAQRGAAVWPIVLGMVGGSFVVAMTASALWILCIRPRLRDPAERDFRRRLESLGGMSPVLSMTSIRQGTHNFGCRIGYGGFGDVFYGRFADGQEIAAKVLTARSLQSKEEFYNEIELLSVVHHKCLVSLLGYSFTREHHVLIYEYMGGGDLRHRLQGSSAARNPLSWGQRISILLQVAEGLEYLHDKCTPAIIHRDVKSNNILQSTNLRVATVADFGLSKLRRKDQESASHITTVVKGTPGYLDPEYHETGLLTEKSDVYAFGIVLMETLTGQHHMSISEGVSEARRLEQYEGLNLRGSFDRDEFVSLVEVSLWCVRKSNSSRPCMREVVWKLQEMRVAPVESVQPQGSSGKVVQKLRGLQVTPTDPVEQEGSSCESPSHRRFMPVDTDLDRFEADSQYISSFSGFLESSGHMG